MLTLDDSGSDGAFEYDEWEFCPIFSAVSILSEDDGAAHNLRAGGCFVICPGFRGSREVVETTRKVFVIWF